MFKSVKQFVQTQQKMQGFQQKMNYSFSSGPKESFIQVAKENPFPIQNIPFGVFSQQNSQEQRIGVAIGDKILDIKSLVQNNQFFQKFSEQTKQSLQQSNLNDFLALSRSEKNEVRQYIQTLLAKDSQFQSEVEKQIFNQQEVNLHLPMKVGDYTDFYASRNHAENVGEMFRGKDNKLMPNWLHMPIAYHGRSSSINVDKTLVRPCGQIDLGVYGEEKRLDIELEMAMILGGKCNERGERIDIQNAGENIGGFSLMNDWSARQIQKVEYVPLGPFLGKNFSTTLSSWVVLPEALKEFKEQIPKQDNILPYLQTEDLYLYDIPLQVYLKPNGSDKKYLISESNMKNLYWSFEQMIAHHSSGGCNITPGDVMASGTISGEDASKNGGSMMEISWSASKPIILEEGLQRTFLEDGDTIILSGGRHLPCGQYLGFGDVETTILPARK